MNSISTKNEILDSIPDNNCCGIAFLSAVLKTVAVLSDDLTSVIVYSDPALTGKIIDNVNTCYRDQVQCYPMGQSLVLSGDVATMLFDCGVLERVGSEYRYRFGIDASLLDNDCCKETFAKAIFLCCGNYYARHAQDKSIGYTLEMIFKDYALADDMISLMKFFDLDFKSATRKNKIVVYTKNSENIFRFFALLGAITMSLNIQNDLTMREMKNSINRANNCYDYNLNKTINTSVKQIQAIQYIRDTKGLDSLPDDLRDIALLRLDHPDATLSELKSLYGDKLSKSGIKYKLDKLENIYNKLIKK